jgi:hypothetical protein
MALSVTSEIRLGKKETLMACEAISRLACKLSNANIKPGDRKLSSTDGVSEPSIGVMSISPARDEVKAMIAGLTGNAESSEGPLIDKVDELIISVAGDTTVLPTTASVAEAEVRVELLALVTVT